MLKGGKQLSIDRENFKKVFSNNIFKEGVKVKGMRKVSKVMECSSFQFNDELEKDFRKPKVVTVGEALGFPVKRRISIEGTLMQVDDVADGINYKRRRTELQEGTSKISLKLWGKESEQSIPQIGSTERVTAVYVFEYNGIKELNSSNDTSIENFSESCADELAATIVKNLQRAAIARRREAERRSRQ
ncbi:uncharacterized protein LOC123534506 [Mercenaria mercenaria]|uniref:uncharacterized protein LOC123534506 n=1 Tax=Mercenaria mercenaria TaxID=6596 RepID=UPI00234F1F39|nr:uncharacterized protein LOC123534506 [Mercenaria mercenaria]